MVAWQVSILLTTFVSLFTAPAFPSRHNQAVYTMATLPTLPLSFTLKPTFKIAFLLFYKPTNALVVVLFSASAIQSCHKLVWRTWTFFNDTRAFGTPTAETGRRPSRHDSASLTYPDVHLWCCRETPHTCCFCCQSATVEPYHSKRGESVTRAVEKEGKKEIPP